ncbi:Ubiquitin carboxyl-terminal hydrolase 1 [Gracilaria domingensis]|nr:Ubiquitin carboxyl-terminal hydrolase 1 [Gracilaria domingensis]
MAPKRWIPLESNPEVLTKFGHALGLSPVLSFCDVWSLDLLDMVPSPQYAVILLFPLTDKIVAAEAEVASRYETDSSKQPFFCKQTIGNACGTIAVLHAALNTFGSAFPLRENSFFDKFWKSTREIDASQRAVKLQEDDALDSIHEEFAQDLWLITDLALDVWLKQQGQTSAPSADEKVGVHFVCFVERDGTLYELDGRKDYPVKHGPSTPATVLQDTACVIKEKFMALDPAENRFTILALSLGQ